MRKKLLHLVLGFFICIPSVFSQKTIINWGEESKKELQYGSFVIGKNNDLIKLCFEVHGGGLFSKKTVTPVLARYNSQLKEMAVKSFEVDDDKMEYEKLMSIRGKLFLFTSQYDKSSKSTSFYCQQLNIETLNTIGKPINLGSFDAISKKSQSAIQYELSKDSSKVLMFGLSPFSKKDNEKYYMGVYDDNMKKLWDNTVELPYKDKFITVFDNIVTNDGQVGVLIKHYDNEVSKEAISKDGEKVPAYKSKLLLYGKDAKTPKEFILDLNNKFVHTLELTSDVNDDLTLFGLYKDIYNSYVTGYFVTNVNKETQKVTNIKMDAFPMDFLDIIKKDGQASNKEKKPGLSTAFKLMKKLERANGSQDFIIEYYQAVYTPPSSHYSNGQWVSSPGYWTYYYGDVIDICLAKNNTTYLTRIPKYQYSRNINIYSGFEAVTYNNKLFLFYNDDKDNVDRDLSKKPDDISNFGKCVFMKCVVDEKGNLDREIIFDHKDTKLTVCTRECIQIAGNKIALYAQKNGGLFKAAKDMIGYIEIK